MHNPFRYCGEYYDEETGLIYLRNRYYDSAIGRFITEDLAQDGVNWYSYCGGNPINFVDPWRTDAVLITSDKAAYGQGHTSVIVQDTRSGNWHYFYWGDKAAYFIKVPWQEGAMSSLDSFNSWLSKQNLRDNTTGYTSATFVEGDFNASVDYFQDLIWNTVVSFESGYRRVDDGSGKPINKYYEKYTNESYKLFGKNCLQVSMEGFSKGTLKDGTSVKSFMSGQLEKTFLADTRPNTAETVFNQLFFNRRFTRAEAKNDIIWEAKYGVPSDKYKRKGLFYAKTLGVVK